MTKNIKVFFYSHHYWHCNISQRYLQYYCEIYAMKFSCHLCQIETIFAAF